METKAIDAVHRAGATNDPLKLLGKGRKNTPEARRFRDLYLFYKGQLGDRADLEHVRVKVLAVIDLTIHLERMTQGVVARTEGKLVRKSNYSRFGTPQTFIYERGDPHTVIHISAQILGLLKSLGLDKDSSDNGMQNGKKKQEADNRVN
jgi:hypothetical protein